LGLNFSARPIALNAGIVVLKLPMRVLEISIICILIPKTISNMEKSELILSFRHDMLVVNSIYLSLCGMRPIITGWRSLAVTFGKC
jgi:hypothetical protein